MKKLLVLLTSFLIAVSAIMPMSLTASAEEKEVVLVNIAENHDSVKVYKNNGFENPGFSTTGTREFAGQYLDTLESGTNNYIVVKLPDGWQDGKTLKTLKFYTKKDGQNGQARYLKVTLGNDMSTFGTTVLNEKLGIWDKAVHQRQVSLEGVNTEGCNYLFFANVFSSSYNYYIGDISLVYEEAKSEYNVNVFTQSGASIRLNNVNGIRFYTSVDAEKINEFLNDGCQVKAGTLIAPNDLLNTSDELEIDKVLNDGKTTPINVEFDINNGWYVEDELNFKGIVGSIAKIKEENTAWDVQTGNITREFVGRGYVIVTDPEGNEIISYSSASSEPRSLKYVATRFINDGLLSTVPEAIQSKLTKWSNSERAADIKKN